MLKKCFPSGLEADLFTYSILINEQCKRASIEQALDLLSRIIKLAVEPDIHTYTIMISALTKQKRMKESEDFRRSNQAWLSSYQRNLRIQDWWIL